MLTNLQATQTSSSIFSAPIWQLSVRPDSQQAQRPVPSAPEALSSDREEVPQHERASGEASTSQAGQSPRAQDLPYHRFAGRDNVILASMDQRLNQKESDYVRALTGLSDICARDDCIAWSLLGDLWLASLAERSMLLHYAQHLMADLCVITQLLCEVCMQVISSPVVIRAHMCLQHQSQMPLSSAGAC